MNDLFNQDYPALLFSALYICSSIPPPRHGLQEASSRFVHVPAAPPSPAVLYLIHNSSTVLTLWLMHPDICKLPMPGRSNAQSLFTEQPELSYLCPCQLVSAPIKATGSPSPGAVCLAALLFFKQTALFAVIIKSLYGVLSRMFSSHL